MPASQAQAAFQPTNANKGVHYYDGSWLAGNRRTVARLNTKIGQKLKNGSIEYDNWLTLALLVPQSDLHEKKKNTED